SGLALGFKREIPAKTMPERQLLGLTISSYHRRVSAPACVVLKMFYSGLALGFKREIPAKTMPERQLLGLTTSSYYRRVSTPACVVLKMFYSGPRFRV
ncbi:hypothetical protein, partial [Psychrobium sp. 1_MG-2023]|uniref:hypothetical protein n=1 Tax=Psychrobium sp. 1_MG-2023 TaxID=3062624 RepID=UPI002735A9EC